MNLRVFFQKNYNLTPPPLPPLQLGLKRVSEKSGITYSINHNFVKIKFDSYNSLPAEKILTFHKCYNTH